MRTLYLDCSMGAAGDMLTAALLELLPEQEKVVEQLNRLGIPGVETVCGPAVKCGIGGTHVSVRIHGQEESEKMHDYAHGRVYEHDHGHGDGQAQGHDHAHEEGHTHGHDHVHEEEHTHGHDHAHEEGQAHVHDNAVEEEQAHGHSHAHEEEHAHGHSHAHEEEHGHDHEHGESHTHHHHSGMHEIAYIVNNLRVSERIRKDILSVFGMIAEAESHVHGVPVSDIHFHEVGTMDAVADIAAVCVLMDRLAPDQVIVSPVHVGSGQVKCAHGILPVPAPATAFILKDVPIYGGGIRGELCTPTGAALLKYFATRFGDMPVMRTLSIGYGMGKKDFPAANCVRALLGETMEEGDTVAELCCNVDDMTAEAVGFAMEALFAAGALEVYTVAAGMKKSRPGLVLHVMCREAMKDEMVGLLFKHTTTIGIRENISRRYTLGRSVEKVRTPYGEVRKKISTGYGVTREKYEYEDLARIAGERGMSIADVLTVLK